MEAAGMKRKDSENLANQLKKKPKRSNEKTSIFQSKRCCNKRMEAPETSQKKRKNSNPNRNPSKKKFAENLANSPKKRKKSDETSDPLGNLANPMKKKLKESDGCSKKANLFNQITIKEADKPQRFNLSRCQLKKKSALPPHGLCEGKSAVELSNNTIEQTDIVDQAIGIFQEDIIMEILSKLPVQPLHRFKCVSKFWNALISDPYFKKKHLNHAKNDQNLQKFLAAKVCPDDACSFYSSSLLSIPLVEDKKTLDFPLNMRPWRCTMLCSCDGLVLLAVYDRIDKDRIDEHLLLWNPSTRESILLPHPKPRLRHCTCGLGYDTTSDDYKILSIDINTINRGHTISSEILVLKSGSWRNCEYPTGTYRVVCPLESSIDSLALTNGTFHWLGYIEKYASYAIVTFNISNEVFGEIPLPEQMRSIFKTVLERGVSVLGGMLCTYATFERRGIATGKVWIWAMKEYGVKESWTALYTIHDPIIFLWARPKYMYPDGEVLLHCKYGRLFSSVFKRSRAGSELCRSRLLVQQRSVYTESLISPKLIT